MITRHFVDVGRRRVHYRRSGSGPPLLLVHQSPRTSAEYEPLLKAWGQHFTCLAPDTPGFGHSDPLPLEQPEVEDFADAAVAFMDAVGVKQAGAYGYHSGAITLVTALKRHPERFTAVAANGYAVWTAQDRERLGTPYIPPFTPQAYGEHLVWVWNRLMEQTWFFPWYDPRPETRLPIATDDPHKVHPVVMDLLVSGDTYRLGYSAMIRADRDLPEPGARQVPVLVTASRLDPLHAHLDRLGELPPEWRKEGWELPGQAEEACLEHLMVHPAPPIGRALAEAEDEGFLRLGDYLVHWRGDRGAERVHLHGPGWSLRALEVDDGLAIDLPGHGLSDDFALPPELDAWRAAAAAAIEALGRPRVVRGHGFSALLACAVAARLGVSAEGSGAALPRPERAIEWAERVPSPMPERYGEHLVRSWGAVRAGTFFWPWFEARPENAIPFDPERARPERLREQHLALAMARGARSLKMALARADWDALIRDCPPARWDMPDWAAAREDVWRP